jgi:hypothetical protein
MLAERQSQVNGTKIYGPNCPRPREALRPAEW